MNRKAIQLAISTIVLLALGIILLIGLTYMITDGFKKFKSSTDPFIDTSQATSVKQACALACQNNVKLAYCCTDNEIDSKPIKCDDERLETPCPAITCEPNFCNSQ